MSQKDHIVSIIEIVPASISILSCAVSILPFIKYESIRDIHEFKYAVVLLISELLSQVVNVFFEYKSDDRYYCIANAFINQFIDSSQNIWMCLLSTLIYRRFYLNLGSRNIKLVKSFIITIPLSLFFAILIVTIDQKYSRKLTCQMDSKENTLEFWVFHYLFTYNFAFMASIFNTFIVYRVNKNLRSLKITKKDHVLINLLSYPYILVLCIFPYFIMRCIEVSGGSPDPWFQSLVTCLYRSKGFFFSVIFITNKKFRRGITFKPGKSVHLI